MLILIAKKINQETYLFPIETNFESVIWITKAKTTVNRWSHSRLWHLCWIYTIVATTSSATVTTGNRFQIVPSEANEIALAVVITVAVTYLKVKKRMRSLQLKIYIERERESWRLLKHLPAHSGNGNMSSPSFPSKTKSND